MLDHLTGLAGPDSLYVQLRSACIEDWRAYVDHDFVCQLGENTLKEECFRHYLGQDYLFLIHFARAYALAVFKSDSLEDMRTAGAGMAAILDEMGLHVRFCRDWGIRPEELSALPEAKATMAYTRFVLERGLAGDLLDLYVALAPCVVGYAEIGRALGAAIADADRNAHRYGAWIDQYAGDDYQAAARAHVAQLDRLMAERGGRGRRRSLETVFRQATILEADFWQMGLTLAM